MHNDAFGQNAKRSEPMVPGVDLLKCCSEKNQGGAVFLKKINNKNQKSSRKGVKVFARSQENLVSCVLDRSPADVFGHS